MNVQPTCGECGPPVPPDHGSSARNHGRTPSYPSLGHAILLCAIVIVLQVALSMPFAIADMVFKSAISRHPALLAAVNLVAIGGTIYLGLLIGKVPPRQVFLLKWVPLRLYLPLIIISFGGVIVLSEVDNLFRSAFPIPEWLSRLFRELCDPLGCRWGLFLLLVVVAPLTEEILMRGLILPGLLNRHRRWMAVALSALLFAGLHLNPWQFFSAAFLGVLFGWYFLRTQSLLPCLFGHAFNNGMVFAWTLLPFAVRGFNSGQELQGTVLQPLWFDALGILLVAAGCWLFRRMTVGLVAPAVPVPPLLSGSQLALAPVPPPTEPDELPPVINPYA